VPRPLSVPRAPRLSFGRPFTRPLSLVYGPRLLDLSLPTIRSHDLRPRCTPRLRPPPPRSFLVLAPTPSSLPSLAPPAELPHSPHITHVPAKTSPLSVVISCVFCSRCRALAVYVASVSFALSPATWDTPRFAPFPYISLGPRSSTLSPRRSSSITVDPRPHRVPATVQRSRCSPLW
jgi:hypothetical protein